MGLTILAIVGVFAYALVNNQNTTNNTGVVPGIGGGPGTDVISSPLPTFNPTPTMTPSSTPSPSATPSPTPTPIP